MGVFLGDAEEFEVGALWAASALFPTSYRVRADVEEAREEDLTRVKRATDFANVARAHFRRGGGKFRHPKIDRFAVFEGEGTLQRFAEVVKHFHFYVFRHCRAFISFTICRKKSRCTELRSSCSFFAKRNSK